MRRLELRLRQRLPGTAPPPRFAESRNSLKAVAFQDPQMSNYWFYMSTFLSLPLLTVSSNEIRNFDIENGSATLCPPISSFAVRCVAFG